MTRYAHDFMGTTTDLVRPRGMDPNFRDGYRGMRMHGDDQQAAYGWYRWRHERDLGGSGGYPGLVDRAQEGGRGGYGPPPAAYDRDWEGGGVRDLRTDRRALREFNAASPGLRYGAEYETSRYGRDYRPRGGSRGALPGHFRGDRFDYGNRGLSSGGYSEGWAWGPMRGAR